MTYRQLLAANADFRRLWSGQVISEIGDWLSNIAVLALTIELAGAGRVGLAIALYAIARHLPLFVFGPVAGVVVDRADRRRVMIAADIARAVLALGFCLANVFQSLPVIYVVGAALFSVSAFFNAAKRASIPNLTRDADELLSANSLSASTTAATIAVGSALGGIIATLAGRNLVFVINSLTFLASAEMIRRIRARTRRMDADAQVEATVAATNRAPATFVPSNVISTVPSTSASSVFAPSSVFAALRRVAVEFREGLRYVRGDNLLSAVFIVAAGWGLGNGAARALYSIFGARMGEEVIGAWGPLVREWVERPKDFGISV
ncbi:MAG: MFS transporter, partial [Pyrinomonadaceae bacterium]